LVLKALSSLQRVWAAGKIVLQSVSLKGWANAGIDSRAAVMPTTNRRFDLFMSLLLKENVCQMTIHIQTGAVIGAAPGHPPLYATVNCFKRLRFRSVDIMIKKAL